MASFRVRLFGKFNALREDRELDCFPSAKAKELFCYLLLHRDRPHPRETLVTLFWGELNPDQTRKYMRQTLWQLQHALHELSGQDSPVVVHADKGSVRLTSANDHWLDVSEFEQAAGPVKGMAGEQMDPACAAAVRHAVSLYEGNLLEGWYQDWCLYHRERLENAYLSMLDKLMAYCELHEEYEMGLSYGERLLLQDRARERTYCRLMRLRYFAGDRVGALREFQRCQVALQEELDVAPAKQTVELHKQICADLLSKQSSSPGERAVPFTAAREDGAPGGSLFRGLHRLRSVLMKIQRRVELDIEEVNSILETQHRSSPHEKN